VCAFCKNRCRSRSHVPTHLNALFVFLVAPLSFPARSLIECQAFFFALCCLSFFPFFSPLVSDQVKYFFPSLLNPLLSYEVDICRVSSSMSPLIFVSTLSPPSFPLSFQSRLRSLGFPFFAGLPSLMRPPDIRN